ncbi:MAG: phosphoribosylglycinamide formyltransferase [Bacillota bacterium]|nr:phosphoribosylglycinamide formyltransferase [Bacillota bacterium]
MKKVAVAVLASGEGSNYRALQAYEGAPYEIALLGTDDPRAPALSKAREDGLPTALLPPEGFPSREAWEKAMVEVLEESRVEWVVLAGFMRILGPFFLRAFPWRVVNLHPSLLPSFRGREAIARALQRGVSWTGITVHLVDEGVDQGPVVIQRPVPRLPGDDEESLTRRIKEAEHHLYPRALHALLEVPFRVEEGRLLWADERKVRLLCGEPF